MTRFGNPARDVPHDKQGEEKQKVGCLGEHVQHAVHGKILFDDDRGAVRKQLGRTLRDR